MAIFYPPIETIKKFKVNPTNGEWALLNFLKDTLDDSFEVYFKPCISCDRPDVIIMRKSYGVMIISVKEYKLEGIKIDSSGEWVNVVERRSFISPIDQINKYKDNLFSLHVKNLLFEKIKNTANYGIVACTIYFHNATQSKINKYIGNELKYYDFIGKDSLNKNYFQSLLEKRRISGMKSSLFTDEMYENFKKIFAPGIHAKSKDQFYSYSGKQQEIIYSNTLEQRVKGVFGSGKTTVLAARAVEAYKRALKRNNNPRILILTYNITLKNFIYDKLLKVNENFNLENFVINNYHSFINAELNNLNIKVKKTWSDSDLSSLEKNYYSNLALFEKHKNEIVKYDAVLIDEIQDYHRSWMEIIKKYFRDPKGDYVLFGDEKQNIYGLVLENKDVRTNVRGVNKLTDCYRSQFKVKDLALSFQRSIFKDRYDIDEELLLKGQTGELDLKTENQGFIDYIYLFVGNLAPNLTDIIQTYIAEKKLKPNSITVLGSSISQLRSFDYYYRFATNDQTTAMFETIETRYLVFINRIKAWTKPWYKYIAQNLLKSSGYADMSEQRAKIASILALFELRSWYPRDFHKKFAEKFERNGFTEEDYKTFIAQFNDDLSQVINAVNGTDDEVVGTVRKNKKIHFQLDTGLMKISTIHSFKGWESENVFLIVGSRGDFDEGDSSYDELLYTGITRCKSNLIIVNIDNLEYDRKLQELVTGAGGYVKRFHAAKLELQSIKPNSGTPTAPTPRELNDWQSLADEDYMKDKYYVNFVRIVQKLASENIPFTDEYCIDGVWEDSNLEVFEKGTGIKWDIDTLKSAGLHPEKDIPIYLFIREDIGNVEIKTDKAKVIIASDRSDWMTKLKRTLGVKR